MFVRARNPVTIHQQFLFALIGVNMLVVLFGAFVFYAEQKKSLLSGIDAKLASVAALAREILPPDYHDRITGPASVSDAEFQKIVERNNRLCVELGLEYIWSLMVVDGQVVFTTSTSPDKIAGNRKHAKFFEMHSNQELYLETFATMRPTYRNCHDKWGNIRVVLIPSTDAHGRKYLFGSSVRLTEVNRQLRGIVWLSMALGLAVFVFSMGVGFWGARLVTAPIQRLTETICEIASGKSDAVAKECGSYEQIALTRHFNQMNRRLQEKISELEVARARLIDQRDSERKQAKDDLVMSERRYYGLLNFAVDGVLIGSSEGIITEANECMCTLFGMSRKEVLGHHLRDMPFTPESVCRCPFEFTRVQNGEIVLSERTIRRPDGSEVEVEMHTKRMSDGTLQSIYRDVTERTKVQAVLKSWNAELERCVAERTEEVEKYVRQLHALTARLNRAEEDERQRLSDVLHEDLQQVLVAARMTLGVALGSVSDAAIQKSLNRVDDMLTRSLRLTRTLAQEIAIPAVREGDLSFAVRWIAQWMQEKFGLQVDLACEEKLGPLDQNVYVCLYRMVQELLFNVIKHAGVKQARIEIQRQEGNYVQITVRDKGCGFSMAAFEDLNKGNDGFGLFSIRERIEGLCGQMKVVSALGEGTTITLTVPMRDVS